MLEGGDRVRDNNDGQNQRRQRSALTSDTIIDTAPPVCASVCMCSRALAKRDRRKQALGLLRESALQK